MSGVSHISMTVMASDTKYLLQLCHAHSPHAAKDLDRSLYVPPKNGGELSGFWLSSGDAAGQEKNVLRLFWKFICVDVSLQFSKVVDETKGCHRVC